MNDRVPVSGIPTLKPRGRASSSSDAAVRASRIGALDLVALVLDSGATHVEASVHRVSRVTSYVVSHDQVSVSMNRDGHDSAEVTGFMSLPEARALLAALTQSIATLEARQ